MKILSTILLIGLLLTGAVCTSQALPLQTEPTQTNPASTVDLWSYSYLANTAINSPAYYTDNPSEYSSAIFEGYLTGIGVRDNVDHFEDYASAAHITRVFSTYITSSIDQTVTFAAGGDDGHSIFIDDVFLAGAGYSYSAIIDFSLVANQIYELTCVGNNNYGHFELWFNIKGDYDQSSNTYGWTGPLSSAQSISMDATGNFFAAPVPEPSTVLLLGSGLLGLGWYGRKRMNN